MKRDAVYFKEECPHAIREAWGDNPQSAMVAFFSPLVAKAWDTLTDEDREAVQSFLETLYGQRILVGTIGYNLYYMSVRRMKLIGYILETDLLNPRKIRNLVSKICDRVNDEEVRFVRGLAKHSIFKTSDYKQWLPVAKVKTRPIPDETHSAPSLKVIDERPVKRVKNSHLKVIEKEPLVLADRETVGQVTERPLADPEPVAPHSADLPADVDLTEPALADPELVAARSADLPADVDLTEPALADPELPHSADLPADVGLTEPTLAPDRPEAEYKITMKLPMFYKYMVLIGNTTPFCMKMPAVQLMLDTHQLTHLRAAFPEFENDSLFGWWLRA